jgi:hypothetical protein
MANSLAKTLADDMCNWFKGTTFGTAAPATTYVALLTTNPTKNDGTGLVECSDTGYARLAITSSSGWSAISTNADNIHEEISNAAALTFGAAVASYTVVGLAVYSALTGGTLYMYGAVTSQAVAIGNQYQIAIGSLILEF